MNEDLMSEYLLAMGAMQPDELEMLRKQKLVDALREKSQQMPEGQMVSGHYVAPSWTQYAANAMGSYNAAKQQQALDQKLRDLTANQQAELEKIRRKYGLAGNPPSTTPGTDAAFRGTTGYSAWNY